MNVTLYCSRRAHSSTGSEQVGLPELFRNIDGHFVGCPTARTRVHAGCVEMRKKESFDTHSLHENNINALVLPSKTIRWTHVIASVEELRLTLGEFWTASCGVLRASWVLRAIKSVNSVVTVLSGQSMEKRAVRSASDPEELSLSEDGSDEEASSSGSESGEDDKASC